MKSSAANMKTGKQNWSSKLEDSYNEWHNDIKDDMSEYEKVDTIKINGTQLKIGDKTTCKCEYEALK
jgi:hypothetical protein